VGATAHTPRGPGRSPEYARQFRALAALVLVVSSYRRERVTLPRRVNGSLVASTQPNPLVGQRNPICSGYAGSRSSPKFPPN
jgi:hypothetical protein